MGVDCSGSASITPPSWRNAPNFEDWAKVLYYNTGLQLTRRRSGEVAERCNNMERLFN